MGDGEPRYVLMMPGPVALGVARRAEQGWAAVMRKSIHVFSGRIYKVGIIRFVDMPAEVSGEIAEGAVNVAVQGTVEGVPLHSR